MEAHVNMTLSVSDEQTDALRRQAAAQGQPVEHVALAAIAEYLARRKRTATFGAPRCWLTSPPPSQ
jgi:hypothetical protein